MPKPHDADPHDAQPHDAQPDDVQPDDSRRSQPDDQTAAERFRERVSAGETALGEEVDLWQGRYSGKAMVGLWATSAVVVVTVAVLSFSSLPALSALATTCGLAGALWIGLALLLGYRKLANSYRLTNQRLIHKSGVLRQVTDRIEVIDMDDVTYVQGIVERLFSVGTIQITSSDRSHPRLDLQGIDEVQRVADLIDDVRRNERRERGVHIETI